VTAASTSAGLTGVAALATGAFTAAGAAVATDVAATGSDSTVFKPLSRGNVSIVMALLQTIQNKNFNGKSGDGLATITAREYRVSFSAHKLMYS
jgi:hypothetical protein